MPIEHWPGKNTAIRSDIYPFQLPPPSIRWGELKWDGAANLRIQNREVRKQLFMQHKERPDALVALTGKFKKEFLSHSSSESDCFLYIAQYPGCTSLDIQTEFGFDQPHVSRVLTKLIEKIILGV